jgi:hypothetical protein
LPVREMARAMVEAAIHPGPDARASVRERVFPPAGLIERGSVAAVPTSQAKITARKAKT